MDFLTEQEKEKVARFCEDDVMMEAVKKVLLAPIYEQGTLKAGQPADPTYNGALALATVRQISDEELGRDLRAFTQAMSQVENAWKKLTEVRPTKEAKKASTVANNAK